MIPLVADTFNSPCQAYNRQGKYTCLGPRMFVSCLQVCASRRQLCRSQFSPLTGRSCDRGLSQRRISNANLNMRTPPALVKLRP